VGGVVVEDGVDQLAGWHGGLDPVEEADELLVPVPRHALADDAAIQDIEGGEQRGRSVPDVIVGHGAGPALLHRQARLGAVERLDLALLVDREHDRVRRRVEIESDDVAQLRGERRVRRQLEAPHPMRLQPVRRPDPLHRAQGYAGRGGHRPAGPVRRLAGRIGERQLDHPIHERRRQRWQAGLARLVAQEPGDTFAHEPLLPAPDARLGHAGLAHDRRRAAALRRRQDDPRPPDMLLRAVAIRYHPFQPVTVGSGNLDLDPLAHGRSSHKTRQKGIL
jgi:hypothetical protein